jgi:deazaflavin-dependent oxidoreductase (nitroreductase family)
LNKTNPSSSSKTSSNNEEKYLYLTTRGRKTGRPREIEIWFTEFEDRYFVIAEYATSQWLQNLQADPAVKIRVSGKEFCATARVVSPIEEPSLHRTIAQLSEKKYGWGDGTVVELRPTENRQPRTEN